MAPKKQKVTQVAVSQPSLDTWISVTAPRPVASSSSSRSAGPPPPSLAELDAELITYSEPIVEKDSIFLAVTFALHAPPSASKLQTLFNKYLSPPRHPSLPSPFQKEKGINPSHRMYGWRALGLKEGRNGKAGPGDFEVKEGSDDDDERWGGDRVLKVIRDRGGVDVLVVCCRWFGGTMIGPIRFQLIEDTTKESLKAHLLLADLQPRKIELLARDARIVALRTKLDPAYASSSPEKKKVQRPTYQDLTMDKADRLLFARGKTIEGLEKKVREAGASGGGVEGARSDLKRRVEEALGDDEGDEDDAEAMAEQERAPLPSFAKKAKVAATDEGDAAEEERGGGGDAQDVAVKEASAETASPIRDAEEGASEVAGEDVKEEEVEDGTALLVGTDAEQDPPSEHVQSEHAYDPGVEDGGVGDS